MGEMDRIEGERVTLRPIAPGDREPLKAIRDEPEVVRFWGEQTAECGSRHVVRAEGFSRRPGNFNRRGFRPRCGWVGLSPSYPPPAHRGDD